VPLLVYTASLVARMDGVPDLLAPSTLLPLRSSYYLKEEVHVHLSV
jgi:hypothetical protein